MKMLALCVRLCMRTFSAFHLNQRITKQENLHQFTRWTMAFIAVLRAPVHCQDNWYTVMMMVLWCIMFLAACTIIIKHHLIFIKTNDTKMWTTKATTAITTGTKAKNALNNTSTNNTRKKKKQKALTMFIKHSC